MVCSLFGIEILDNSGKLIFVFNNDNLSKLIILFISFFAFLILIVLHCLYERRKG